MEINIPEEVVQSVHALSALRRFHDVKDKEEMARYMEQSMMLQMHIWDMVASIILKEQYGTLDVNHS